MTSTQLTKSPGLSSTLDSSIKTAYELLQAGRTDEADTLCKALLTMTPNVRTAALASSIAQAQEDLPRALQIVDAAIEHHGEGTELLLRKAQVLMQLRHRTEGIEAARRAAEVCPPDARLLLGIAKLHIERNEPAQAQPLLQRALELQPTDPVILYTYALSHFYLNEMDQAASLLERVLTLAPGNGFALYLRSQLGTQARGENHAEHLRTMLLRPHLRKQDAIPTYFALAKELEDAGEYQESFAALSEGNRVKRSTLDYDVGSDLRAFGKVIEHYSRASLERAKPGEPATGPIFVVGMPRTGTTLVERILGSHANVVSLGELVDFPAEMTLLAKQTYADIGSTDPDFLGASLQMDFGELGRNYLRAVHPLTAGHDYFVDKLPFNFRYCGLIHRALPNAKIVHVTRDPLDTCYAIFKTLFINAYHYSYQLDELAQFYIGYRRTMEHWHAVLPGVVCDVNYEELVADPPAQSRRLLEYCGLPWRDDVLEFHALRAASTTASAAQVRKPIYTSSVNKWRNFEQQLQPVVRRLAAAGLVDVDGNPLPAPPLG
jgi:tetratricopeptide (TPR) repeat protein